jgi:hypothetical protein
MPEHQQATRPSACPCAIIPALLIGWPIGGALGALAIVALPYASDAYAAAAAPAGPFAWWEWPWGWPGVRMTEAHFTAMGFSPAQPFSWMHPMEGIMRWPLALGINLAVLLLPLWLVSAAAGAVIGLWRRFHA